MKWLGFSSGVKHTDTRCSPSASRQHQGLYAGGEGRGGVPSPKRNIRLCLPGQLADYCTIAGILRLQIQTVSQLVTSLGLIINTEKSALVPWQQIQFLGVTALRRGKGCPNSGESDIDHRMCHRTVASKDCSSQTVDESLGSHSKPDSCPTPVSPPHERDPAPRARQVHPPAEPPVNPDPQLTQDHEGGGYHVIGQVDTGYRQTPHQQAGTSCYLSCPTEATPTGQGTSSQGTLRQPISGDVCQPPRGNPQQIAISPNSQATDLVPAPRDTSPNETSSGGGQQDSRCSVQGRNRHRNTEKSPRDIGRMAAEQSSVSDPIQSVGETVRRPICDEVEQPASSLLHVGQRPHGLRNGCHVHQLGQDAGVCVSPHRSDTQGPGETLKIQELQDACNSASVAQAIVVPEAAVSHSSRADQPALEGEAHPSS